MNITTISESCELHARIGWQGLTKKEYLNDGEYYLVTGVDFDHGHIAFNNCHFVTKERYDQDEHIQLRENDVLVTKDGTIGKVAIIDHPIDKPATLNSGVFVVRPKNAGLLLPRYLMFVLLSNHFSRFIEKIKVGCTIAHLNQEKFLNYEFPLPSIEEQRHIIRVFDTMFSVLNNRKRELSILDNLIKARFVEMFGEPATNPMQWPETTIGVECHYIKDGPHKSLPDIGRENGGHPFISVRNIVNHTIDFSSAKYISNEDYKDARKKCCPEKGDMLYSKGGTTGIAKLIDTDIEFANWVHLAVLKFDKHKLNGIFFENMLNSEYCYDQSQRLTKGVANRDLVLSAMAQIKMYRPTLELQEQFAAFVAQVDKSKSGFGTYLRCYVYFNYIK